MFDFIIFFHFEKCKKLYEHIYTYFFIISIILLNNFFYNKDRCWCNLKKIDYNIYFWLKCVISPCTFTIFWL